LSTIVVFTHYREHVNFKVKVSFIKENGKRKAVHTWVLALVWAIFNKRVYLTFKYLMGFRESYDKRRSTLFELNFHLGSSYDILAKLTTVSLWYMVNQQN